MFFFSCSLLLCDGVISKINADAAHTVVLEANRCYNYEILIICSERWHCSATFLIISMHEVASDHFIPLLLISSRIFYAK